MAEAWRAPGRHGKGQNSRGPGGGASGPSTAPRLRPLARRSSLRAHLPGALLARRPDGAVPLCPPWAAGAHPLRSALSSPLSPAEPLLSNYYVPATGTSPGATAEASQYPLHTGAWSWGGNVQRVRNIVSSREALGGGGALKWRPAGGGAASHPESASGRGTSWGKGLGVWGGLDLPPPGTVSGTDCWGVWGRGGGGARPGPQGPGILARSSHGLLRGSSWAGVGTEVRQRGCGEDAGSAFSVCFLPAIGAPWWVQGGALGEGTQSGAAGWYLPRG